MDDEHATSPGEPPLVPPVAGVLGYSTRASHIPPEWTNATTHGIQAELAPRELWLGLRLFFLTRIPFLALIFGINFWLVRKDPLALRSAMIFLPAIFGILMAMRIGRMWLKFRRTWRTFRIVIGDQGVLRYSAGLPELTLHWEQIRRAREVEAGILLFGPRKVDLLMIPCTLENYEEVRDRTRSRVSIEKGSLSLIVFRALIPGLAMFAAFVVGLQTNNHALRWSLVALTLAIALWSIVRVLRSPNVTFSQKLISPVTLLIPLFLMAMEIVPPLWQRFFP